MSLSNHFIWILVDRLRPEAITPATAPALSSLAARGVFTGSAASRRSDAVHHPAVHRPAPGSLDFINFAPTAAALLGLPIPPACHSVGGSWEGRVITPAMLAGITEALQP